MNQKFLVFGHPNEQACRCSNHFHPTRPRHAPEGYPFSACARVNLVVSVPTC